MNAWKNVHGVKDLTQNDYTQYIQPKRHYSDPLQSMLLPSSILPPPLSHRAFFPRMPH